MHAPTSSHEFSLLAVVATCALAACATTESSSDDDTGPGSADGGGGPGPGPGGADGGGGPGPSNDAGGGDPVDGLGPWTGNDDVAPSQSPPFGLAPNQVPMFVALGFDDNAYSGLEGSAGTGGMTWATEMLAARTNPDGTPARASFYLTSTYAGSWISESPTFVKRAWHTAYLDGHEIGNHTHSHSHGAAFGDAQWNTEIETCLDWVTRPFDPAEPSHTPNDAAGAGVPLAEIYGFRTPFLEYNDATLASVRDHGFWYDCSIEDGYQTDHDGSNYNWPYTLDSGSPGHDILVEWELKDPITPHPGLWELPVHPVIVPPDDQCAAYGVPVGLRAKMKAYNSWFDEESGKITGFDYNLWVLFKMTKAEFLATMKYTLDQRLAGNRAPLMFGAHTDYYSSKYTAPPNSTVRERQEAIEELLDYALTKPDVRVVSNKHVLDWVRNPVSLR